MLLLKLEIDSKINFKSENFKSNLEKRFNKIVNELIEQNSIKRSKRDIQNKTEFNQNLTQKIQFKIVRIEEASNQKTKKQIKIYFNLKNGNNSKVLDSITNNLNNNFDIENLSQKLRFKVTNIYNILLTFLKIF